MTALGAALLVPATVLGGSGMAFVQVASSSLTGSPLPGLGDVLRALVSPVDGPDSEYGASGRLPVADALSAELLDALSGPDSLDTDAGPLATVPTGPLGIPGVALDAYLKAAQNMARTNPNCGVHWSVLASIGRIESNHARGGQVDANGTTISPIIGLQLNGGPGVAAIRDSDDGRLDGDRVWDRAVGPMQFIPSTWARYAVDGNGDGLADPHNIYDATLAAAHYLCAGGEDLREPAALARALFRYNRSESYVRTVLAWAAAYAAGVTPLPSTPAPSQPGSPRPGKPGDPGDPSRPPGSTNPPGRPTFTPPPTSTSTPTQPTCPPGTSPPTSSSPTSTSTSSVQPCPTDPTETPTSPTTSSESPSTNTSSQSPSSTDSSSPASEPSSPSSSSPSGTSTACAPDESTTVTPTPTSTTTTVPACEDESTGASSADGADAAGPPTTTWAAYPT